MQGTGGGTGRTTLWFIIGFIALVTAGVIFAAATSNGAPAKNADFLATTIPPIVSSDWSKGNAQASVSLVEYGDFECPACAAYFPLVNKLITDYGDRVHFVFRNFPLYAIHPDAGVSAEAAEAAGRQGKYWEMFDLLYKNQATWASAPPETVTAKYFDGYASSLGLNLLKFHADMSSKTVADKIQTDVTSANSAQVDHTPTFFVNLKQVPNPSSYDEFKALLDKALAAASPAGAAPSK